MNRRSALLALLLLALFVSSCSDSEPDPASAPAPAPTPTPPDPAVSTANEIATEIEPLMGTAWYGVYFGGKQKSGFAKLVLRKQTWAEQEVYAAKMGLSVDFDMAGIRQKMIIKELRYYKLTGELLGIETFTSGVLGETELRCEVKGDKLVMTSTVSGHTTRDELPAPNESLASVLAGRRLIREGKIGSTIRFTAFQSTLKKSVTVASTLQRIEDRVVNGVKVRIGVVESEYLELGMKSTEYVTAGGDLLETVIGGMFALRKEPKQVAMDVRAAFDPIRAGLIPVKKPLGDPERITALTLRFSGVPRKEALIDDERQSYELGDGPEPKHTVTLKTAQPPKEPLTLPIKLAPEDAAIAKWLKPSSFAQSDAPAVVKAARKIVGDETNSLKAAMKIQAWVYANVEKKYLAAMSNAVAVLGKMEGDCSEHSVLFVALCRAAGIPAREAVGIGYSDTMGAFGYHAWGEVYVGKWVAMDPTWGEDFADATHVKFGVGETESFGAIAGLFGSLKIEVIEVKRK